MLKNIKTTLVLLGIVLGVLLRIIYAKKYLPYRDSILYVEMANQARNNDFWYPFTESNNEDLPPLLHLFLGGIGRIGGDIWFWGNFIMLVFFALTAYGLFLCGDLLFPKILFSGLIPVFLFATNPFFIEIGSNIMRDNIYYCITVYALYSGLKIQKKTNEIIWLFSYGLLSSLGILCRKEGFELVIVFLLWCLYEFVNGKRSKNRVLFYALVVIIVLITTLILFSCSFKHNYPFSIFIKRMNMKIT